MGSRADRSARESRLASGWTVEEGPGIAEPDPVPEAADTTETAGGAAAEGEEPAAPSQQLGAGMLVVLGIVGGLYLLYTVVWFSWAKFYTDAMHDQWVVTMGSFGAVLQTVLFWTAPFAPALWFLCAVVLNRGVRVRRMLLWLLIGAVLVVPLPVFAGGN